MLRRVRLGPQQITRVQSVQPNTNGFRKVTPMLSFWICAGVLPDRATGGRGPATSQPPGHES